MITNSNEQEGVLEMSIKPGGIALIIILVAALIFGLMYSGVIPTPGKKVSETVTLSKGDVQKIEKNTSIANVNFTLPSKQPVNAQRVFRIVVAAWNSQMGLMAANGGVFTTQGSLIDKYVTTPYKVAFQIVRDDDYGGQQKKLISFAHQYANGNINCGEDCVQIAAYMGDGGPSYMRGANEQIIKELGIDYILKGFGSTGYSRGEDKLLGPPEWKSNPQSMRGSLIVVVLRDGDFNIILKYAADNKIPINPDETTYDPDAINFVAANSFSDAGKIFNAGQPETRPVVKKGRLQGQKITKVPDGVSTWLPWDEKVVHGRGGVITIASTKEYAGQMPNFMVAPNRFLNDNGQVIEGLLRAISDGSEAVKASKQALHLGAEVSAAAYGEETAEYWEMYFNGLPSTVYVNGQSYQIELGGSSANNLADMWLLFGMLPGSRNIFGDTYNYFGNLYKQMYPQYLPDFPPCDESANGILNLRFLRNLQNQLQGAQAPRPTLPTFTPGAQHASGTLSQKIYSVEFQSNSDQLTPRARVTLEQIASEQSMTMFSGGDIVGYTDSMNTAEYNQDLSYRRARTVQMYLYNMAPINFPMEKYQPVGKGEENPIADNGTPEGRARNRRVEVVLYR
jgi:OmpA-OmpF porin, OOP family